MRRSNTWTLHVWHRCAILVAIIVVRTVLNLKLALILTLFYSAHSHEVVLIFIRNHNFLVIRRHRPCCIASGIRMLSRDYTAFDKRMVI